jgi:hypothetical protein
MEYRKITEEEIKAFNFGLKQAQWQITKAMLALTLELDVLYSVTDIKNLMKFIHDEIEKEKK